jgi:hypothetical protein
MDDREKDLQALMADRLRAAEARWKHDRDDVTRRAQIYMEDGLPLRAVLGALGIAERTWYRRVRDLGER